MPSIKENDTNMPLKILIASSVVIGVSVFGYYIYKRTGESTTKLLNDSCDKCEHGNDTDSDTA